MYLRPSLMVDKLSRCSGEEDRSVFHFLSIVGGCTPFTDLQGQATHSLVVPLGTEAATVWAGNMPIRTFPLMSRASQSSPAQTQLSVVP